MEDSRSTAGGILVTMRKYTASANWSYYIHNEESFKRSGIKISSKKYVTREEVQTVTQQKVEMTN